MSRIRYKFVSFRPCNLREIAARERIVSTNTRDSRLLRTKSPKFAVTSRSIRTIVRKTSTNTYSRVCVCVRTPLNRTRHCRYYFVDAFFTDDSRNRRAGYKGASCERALDARGFTRRNTVTLSRNR